MGDKARIIVEAKNEVMVHPKAVPDPEGFGEKY